MSDEQEEFKKKLQALKPKKKKLAVPEGFLDDAKSYEGKLEAVKIISEREKDRVILIFKKMIAQGKEDAIRIEREKLEAKRAAEAKEALERAAKIAKEKSAKKSLFGKKK
jgi:predicted ribonuclease YlaK